MMRRSRFMLRLMKVRMKLRMMMPKLKILGLLNIM